MQKTIKLYAYHIPKSTYKHNKSGLYLIQEPTIKITHTSYRHGGGYIDIMIPHIHRDTHTTYIYSSDELHIIIYRNSKKLKRYVTFFGLGIEHKGKWVIISWYAHSSRSVNCITPSSTRTLPYVSDCQTAAHKHILDSMDFISLNKQ